MSMVMEAIVFRLEEVTKVHHDLTVRSDAHSFVRMEVSTSQSLAKTTKPLGEPAVGEKVRRHLLSLLAKRVKTTIIPTSFVKMVGSPKPIVDSQPRKKLDLGRCPTLPNQHVHASNRGLEDLCLIC
jgi:hypothetical protein